MSDILFIHSAKSLNSKVYSIMPVGVIAILNLIRDNGYSIEGINIGLENSLDSTYNIAYELENNDYSILFLDLHWYEHAYCVIQIAMLSKKFKPNVPVVIGGMTASIYSYEILENFACIDYILRGDSEKSVLMLLDSIFENMTSIADIPNIAYRYNDIIITKKINYFTDSLDKLNYLDIDFIRNHEYIYKLSVNGLKNCKKFYWIGIARGCAYNCANCCGAKCNNEILYGRNNILVRSPYKVFEDIKKLCELEVETICITHDMEMLGKAFYMKLFSLLRKNSIKPGLYIECFQAPSITYLDEIIKTVDLNRTIIALSPLTGDEVTRSKNGKSFSDKKLFEIVEYLTSKSAKTNLYYSLNLPYETEQSFVKTMEQIKILSKKFKQVGITASKVVIDPLAPMRYSKDLVKPLLNSFIDYYHYCTNNDNYFVGYEEMDSITLAKRDREIRKILKTYGIRFHSIGG